MTDERMDARLRDAGEQWRAANTTAASVALDPATEIVDIVLTSAAQRRRFSMFAVAASILAVAGLAIGFAVAFTGSDGQHHAATTDGASALYGRWLLGQLGGPQGPLPQDVVNVSIEFSSDGTFSGSDGCNHLSGNVRITDTTVDFGNGLATTDMACVDRAPEFDAQVALIHKVFDGRVQWSVTPDGLYLTLTKAAVGVMTFGAAKETTVRNPSAIVGVWTLDTIGEVGLDGTASSVLAGPQGPPAIEFSSGGVYTLNDGCNSGGGTATIGTGKITHMHGASTLALCTDAAVNAQAAKVDAVLNGDLDWSIQNGRLTLSRAGVGYLVYGKTGASPGGVNTATDLPATTSD